MIKSKVVALIKSRLGDRTDPGIDAKIDAELDMAQYELERTGEFTPWFLLSETATYQTAEGEARVPIPSDMLQEYEEGALFYGGLPLEKQEYEPLRKRFYGTTGSPQAYTLVDEYFIVFPTPDAIYSLDMKYYQEDTVPSSLDGSGENKWLKNAADWLLAKAGVAIARFIKDTEAAVLFTADEQRAAVRVHKSHVRWMEENIERQMGDN